MKPQHFDWTTPEGLPIIRGAFARMLAKGLLSMAYELHDAVEFNETYNIGLKAFDVLPNEKKVWLLALHVGFIPWRHHGRYLVDISPL